MKHGELYNYVRDADVPHDAKIVVAMPDDPEAVYAVEGVRYNSEKKQLEVVVA